MKEKDEKNNKRPFKATVIRDYFSEEKKRKERERRSASGAPVSPLTSKQLARIEVIASRVAGCVYSCFPPPPPLLVDVVVAVTVSPKSEQIIAPSDRGRHCCSRSSRQGEQTLHCRQTYRQCALSTAAAAVVGRSFPGQEK